MSSNTKKILITISIVILIIITLNYFNKNKENFENKNGKNDNNDNQEDNFILDNNKFSTDHHLVSMNDVPIGTIVAWGSSKIPKGWSKCDGKVHNGIQTPDLTGKFVYGSIGDTSPPITNDDRNQYKVESGNMNLTESQMLEMHKKKYEYTLNQQGGLSEHALSMEEMPRHNHKGKRFHSGWGLGDFGWYTDYGKQGSRDAGGREVKDTDGTPLKDEDGKIVYETKPHTNMPPYHTLYWIMFVGY